MTGAFDRKLIDGLGIDETQLLDYIATRKPGYLEFEAWVRSHAGNVQPETISSLNASYSEAVMSEGSADARRAELGMIGAERRGALLNDLDDWSALHRQLVSAAGINATRA